MVSQKNGNLKIAHLKERIKKERMVSGVGRNRLKFLNILHIIY